MNKKITLLAVLVAFAASSFAQISFDVKSKSDWVSVSEFDYNLTSYLTNSTDDDADTSFQWWVSNADMPSDWEITVCSGLLCVPSPSGTYDFDVAKGAKMEFKLGFGLFDTDVAGNGSAWVIAQSKKNPMVMDSFYLELRAGTASITPKSGAPSFTAYPNPATDKVNVTFANGGTKTVLLYDILGNLKKSETIVSGTAMNVSDLVKGVYVMRIEGDATYSKVIQKL